MFKNTKDLMLKCQIFNFSIPKLIINRLNQCATTETLVGVMKGMNTIMKQANSAIDVKSVQMAIETFGMEVEKQNILQGISYALNRQNKSERS